MIILKSILIVTIIVIEISYCKTAVTFYKTEEYTFFINTAKKYNWFEAWNECSARNMSLIAVDTIEKHEALEAVLRKEFPKAPTLWLGGHDLGEKGKFMWASTGKQFDFSNWEGGQPDNKNGEEHCVYIWDITDFKWNDGICEIKIGYICEMNRFVAALEEIAINKPPFFKLFDSQSLFNCI